MRARDYSCLFVDLQKLDFGHVVNVHNVLNLVALELKDLNLSEGFEVFQIFKA